MKTAVFNLIKRFPAKKKILSLVLTLSLLISLFPISDVAAWSAPANVTINKSANASYFTNQWNTPLTSGFYYVAGSGELAYCAKAKATGPGGTGYTLNDGGLNNPAYLSGIQAIIQNGYPKYTNGLSADDARYATQIAIHWIENYYLGAGQGYDASIRGTTNANGHDGALAFALVLYDVGVSVPPMEPKLTLGAPSAWVNVGGVAQCNVYVDETNTDSWQVLSLPAGVTSVGGVTFLGDENLTLQLTDAAAYAASSKTITLEGYSNRDISNIHVFTTSGGYQSMVGVSTQTNGQDPAYAELGDATGDMSIHKVTSLQSSGAQVPEAGAVFQVYSVSTGTLVSVFTTDAAGNAAASNLPAGQYNVHQAYAPPGTILAPDQLVSVTSGAVAYGNFVNNSTYFPITKYDADNGALVAGATITISQSGVPIVSAVTGADGNAWFESLPAGQYSWQESAAPSGYTLNPDTYSFTLNADGSVSGNTAFTNARGNGYIEVYKTTNRSGILYAEPGAVFQIYLASVGSYAAASAAERDQITTDASGYAISKVLPYGLYSMIQTSTPTGTVLNGDTWQFWVGQNGAGTTITGDVDTGNIDNAAATGYLHINKTTSRGVNVAESGAVFQVFLTSAGSYAAASAAEKDQLTTDAAGTATSKAMPYGLYTVHQTGIPAGTKAAADFTVTLGAVNGATIVAPVSDLVYWGSVTINKTLSFGGVTSNEAGAVFQIYNSAYASYAAALASEKDQITTDAAGSASSKSMPYGTYTIRQTAAPAGAQLNAGTWSVLLGADGATFIDNDVDVQAITDQPSLNQLEILKTTARSTNVAEAGAQFQVWNTNYASYDAAPAEFRDTLTTDAAGYDISVLLPYGTYTVHQTAAPAGTKTVADFTVALTSVNGTVIHRDLVNNTYWGQAEINKTTSFGSYVKFEASAVFQVYLTSAGSYAAASAGEKDQITTDTSGHAITKFLPYGSYTAVQVSSPTGAQINLGSWTFILGLDGATYVDNDVDTQNIADIPTFGKLEISKQTNRGYFVDEGGASFEVYSNEFASYAAALTDYKTTITTDAAGYAITGDLPYGVYTVHQSVVPAGTKAAADFTVTLGATNGAVVHRDLVNQVYWGQAEINKTTELAGNVKLEAGATFEIYDTAYASYAAAPIEEKDTITTDANGHAISKLLPYGTYTASQTVTPSGAQINAGTWTFILGIDGAAYVDNDVDTENIVNLPTFGQLDLSKTTNRGFSVDEAGATFEIYCTEYASFAAAPAEYKDTITTDINGDAVTKLLPYGEYSVHQSVMPAGTKAVADYTVSLKIAQGSVVHQDLVNETFWGDIQVLKYKSAPSSTSGVLTPESDATFRIYPSEYSTWDAALATLPADQEIVLTDEITSDMGGIAVTNHQLPYGEYTVEQIDTLANLYTFKVDAWQVFIGAADDQTYTYVRNNEIYEQYLAISKTDAETGQVIRMAGATFQILAADGVTVLTDSNGDDSFVTDANGRIDIKDLALQVGNYFIRETKAPMGYALNPDLKAFAVSIADHGSSIVTIDYGVDIRSELFADTAQTCQLIVEKQGDVLTSVTLIDAKNAETGTRYSDEDGNALSIYDFGYSLTGKTGAVFEVFVGSKDIGDNAGLLKTFDKDCDGVKETLLTAGTSLGMITTAAVLQKDGTSKYIASLDELPLDAVTGTAQYVVKEVTAPTGDLINPDPLTFDFAFADQTITQIDQEQSITDARQKVQLTVEKQKEAAVWNETTQSFDWPLVSAPEILFGLYTATDILAPDGSVLVAADTLVDVMYTDVAGIGKTTQDIPMGSYYAKELNVTPDVVYDGTTTYPIIALPTKDQHITTAVFALNDGDAIVNREIAGTMKVFKKAADTSLPMPGVVFEVYDNLGNLVDTITTGSDGQARTIVLPYGTYYLIETSTSTGYALSGRINFSIYLPPTADTSITEDEITILNYRIPVTPTPTPTPTSTPTPIPTPMLTLTPSPAPTEILGVFRESVSKTGEQGGSKIAAGAMLLLLFAITQLILMRRRHLDEEK